MTTIKITTTHGDHEVDAHIYGDWAAHRVYNAPGWDVTHVPSGRYLPGLLFDPLNEREARAVAKALHEQCDGSVWVGVSRTDAQAQATPEMQREGVKVRDVALEALRLING